MLLQRAKTQSERYIASRRQQEESINKLATKLKQENHERAFATWEVKGQTVDKKNFYKQKMSQLREAAQRQIEQRRTKLNELLKQEHEQFKSEIEGIQETSEQVRERMLLRVKELKTQKELERQKYVTEQYERKFEEEADELRKIDVDFKQLKTTHERNIQTMEKQKALIDNYNEEMIYAELYKRDIRKKEKQEQEALEEQRKKVNERNKILGLQKNQLEEKSQQEKVKENLEKQMLNEEWRKEDERLKKQAEELFQVNRKMNKNMIAVNFEEKFVKEEEKKLEKIKDKNWISEVVAKEKALEKLDYEIREKQKKETRDFLLNFKNRTNELNNDEQELNKLIQEEDDKQWKKRIDVWQKEEEQRVKLMYEVYESRAKALDNKKAVTEIEKQEKEREKQKLNEELESFIRQEEQTREELWKRNKEYQMNIIKQRESKIDQERLKELQKKKESEEEKQREIEYQKKIEAKKLKGKELLDELRKMRPF